MKKSKKLKFSFNNFPVKIFGKCFNSSFSKQFYILFKKKSVYQEFTKKAHFSLSFCHYKLRETEKLCTELSYINNVEQA